ncbi:MAG: D-alanine--D-alanine ligase [Bacteroidota bacterium]|nr:D-alanine--D-alanine ligase [Bacteroidota bacterium]
MRIGLVYDLFDDYPWQDGEAFDAAAEQEPEETVEALEAAFRSLGHEPVRIGPARNLLLRMDDPGIDVGLSIAEGARSRNREGEAPTLFELMGVPYLGSDALTMSLSLDKVWTKDLAVTAGVATPTYAVVSDPDAMPSFDAFPAFVKPRYEGSAKGLTEASRVNRAEELTAQVRHVIKTYGQDALVESFIEGGEFTVAIVGHDPVRSLPVIQRAVEASSGIGLHVLERKGLPEKEYEWALPGDLSPELEAQLQTDALAVFNKLECHDFARIDFRVDREGTPWFLEINPLPTFAPDGTFAIMAELMGQSYPEFLAALLEEALRRVV